eukprot:2582305-Prymnesium_polylepis.1
MGLQGMRPQGMGPQGMPQPMGCGMPPQGMPLPGQTMPGPGMGPQGMPQPMGRGVPMGAGGAHEVSAYARPGARDATRIPTPRA